MKSVRLNEVLRRQRTHTRRDIAFTIMMGTLALFAALGIAATTM